MLDPEQVASRLPQWLRVVLVGCLVVVASGAGLFGYRYFTQPKTLTSRPVRSTGMLSG
jgi:hypothetical protein